MARPTAAAAAALLLVLTVGVALALSPSGRHQLGSNLVRPLAFVAVVPAGEELCQARERVPSGTAGVEMRIGTFGRPGPPLRLTIEDGGGPPVTGRLAPGWREGDVTVPMPDRAGPREEARVCVRNEGERRIAVAGGPQTARLAKVGRRRPVESVRVTYYGRGSQTWWALAPSIGERIDTTRDALPGPATLPLFVLLALGTIGGAVALVLRAVRA